jgi:hypothetical protein
MIGVQRDNGEVILVGDLFDLKIDTNRQIYVRYKLPNKQDKQFNMIGSTIEYGMTRDDKEAYLIKFRQKLTRKLQSESVVALPDDKSKPEESPPK